MKIALITDAYPPLRSSGAVQVRDLARELSHQGHSVTVMLPAVDIDPSWSLEYLDGVQVIRLKAPRMKDVGYFRRTLAELLMPHAMLFNLRRSPLAFEVWDGVIYYSPSIFHGPLIRALKKFSACRSYLIIRDIFPEWAVDMGLMRRSIPYYFFKTVALRQYAAADVIGVQSKGNLGYFDRWLQKPGRSLHVLENWLGQPGSLQSPIRIEQTALAGRKIFVYAGNMGVAQDIDIFIDLADRLKNRKEVGFIFVGRGSEALRLRLLALKYQLSNVIFFNEIHPDEIYDLYMQCAVGLVSLDRRHKTHNIPGKFLSYMQAGLPVLACINRGNDLASLIRGEHVGQVCESSSVDELFLLAELLLDQIATDNALRDRCKTVFERHYSVNRAAQKISTSLDSRHINRDVIL